MLQSLSVKAKVLLCSYVPLVLALAIGCIAIVSINAMSRTQAWVDHTRNVLRDADNVVLAAVNMETGMRGYLLAGDPQFLEPLEAGRTQFHALIAELAVTVSDNPPQVARLGEAEALIDTWMAEIVTPRLALRAEIGDALTMNDMADRVALGEGKAYFDAFRAHIAEFISNERTLLEQRLVRLDRRILLGNLDRGAVNDALDWVNHTYRVIIAAEQILSSAIDIETGMRGFLLAGRTEFLEPLEAGTAAFADAIERLQQTVDDNPSQVALLQEAQGTIADWQSEVVTPMLELRRDIGDAPTMDDMSDIVRAAEGKVYFDAFRELMAAFSAEEEALMIQRMAANDTRRTMTLGLIAAAMAVALLSGSVIATVTGRNIGGAISALTAAMKRLADGDTSQAIPHLARRDEVGDMAKATEVFKANTRRVADLHATEAAAQEQRQRVLSKLGAALEEVSHGRLGSRLQEGLGAEYESAEYESLFRHFNTAMASLQHLVGAIDDSSATVSTTIEAISGSSARLSQQTESSAAALQQTTTSLGQISDSVSATSRNAAEADRLVNAVKVDAETAGQLVQETVASVGRIDASSEQISKISTAISDIAFQTNLLALNAGVEAARAGSSGSGFAVVASEVRALALRTSDAAREIEDLIRASGEETKQGVELVERTSDALQKIIDEIANLTASVSGIALEAEQQAEGIDQVKVAMASLDQATQQNAVGLEETAAAALSLSTEADGLRSQVSRFSVSDTAQARSAA